MILPSKHLSQERALLTVGARVLEQLARPRTVSALWERIAGGSDPDLVNKPLVRYDSFVLTLDLLFLLGAIDLKDGLLHRTIL